MKDIDIKKSLLKNLMGKMDDMASKRFKKGDVMVEVEVESEGSPLRQAARDIYEAINGVDSPMEREEPKTEEEMIRKQADEKIKDAKMDKIAEALGKFIDAYKG